MMRTWAMKMVSFVYRSEALEQLTRLVADDYVDYDSDYEAKLGPVKDVDPYAGEYILNYEA